MHTLHALALLTLASSSAFALEPKADAPPAPSTQQEARVVEFKLIPHAVHTFDANFKNGGGKTSVFRAGPAFELDIPIGERGTLGFSASAEFSRYRFNNATAFGAGGPKPIRSTYEYELNLSYSHELDDKWSFFVAAGVNAAGEFGADFGESLTYGGGGGVTYAFSKDFKLGLGAIVRTRLEENSYIVPLPLITWKFAPQWEFTTRYRNARLNFQAADQWLIFASAEFNQREYRLDKDAPTSQGVFRDRAIPLSLGITFSPNKTFEITAGAGVNLYRRMTLDDKSGNRVAQVKTEPSLLVFVNAAIKF